MLVVSRIGQGLLCLFAWVCFAFSNFGNAADPASGLPDTLTVIVMDPLSAKLSCDCVKGYAQRKYEVLGAYLEKSLGLKQVNVVWSENLETALKGDAQGKAHLVIGKDSVIRFDAKETKRELAPIAMLSGANGNPYQHGLFVVLNQDPAASVLDIEGYTMLYGPQETDEKCATPRRLLEDLGVKVTSPSEPCLSCSQAAKKLVELGPKSKTAAVISSYAQPLLEGCGSVKKGELKIIGQTDELPFISAFVDATLPAAAKAAIEAALLNAQDAQLLQALESQDGFIRYQPPQKKSS